MVKEDTETLVCCREYAYTHHVGYEAEDTPPSAYMTEAEYDSHGNSDGSEECSHSTDEDNFWSVAIADCPTDEIGMELVSQG